MSEAEATLDELDRRMLATCRNMVETLLASAQARSPEQFDAAAQMQAGLDLRLIVTVPAHDPALLKIDLLATEGTGEPVVRYLSITGRRETCSTH